MRKRSLLLAGAAALTTASILLFTATRGMPAESQARSAASAAGAHVAPTATPTLAGSSSASLTELLAGATDQQSAHTALVAALQRDPVGTLAALEAFLRDADPQSDLARTAVAALVAVGTPEMQAALVELVDARITDTDFVKLVVPTLGFLAAPTRETEAAVRNLTTDQAPEATRHTAHLTLGTMASRVDGARATAIVEDYAARLAKAPTADERRRWLSVLGNAGTPEAAAAVETQLRESDPLVRSRAVAALRRVESPEADAKLTRALDDSDPRVRASAAWSLSYRNPTSDTLRAMIAKLAGETNADAAQALLDAIWMRRLADRDTVIAAVQAAATGHPAESVRERARKMLEDKS
jgi:HEAT repeat protein